MDIVEDIQVVQGSNWLTNYVKAQTTVNGQYIFSYADTAEQAIRQLGELITMTICDYMGE